MRPVKEAWLLCVGIVGLTTGCLHGECYQMRFVSASGVFGDTLVAVSGNGPGSVQLELNERNAAHWGKHTTNITGVVDSVATVRMTLVSDASRATIWSDNKKSNYFDLSTSAFDLLFVHIATEDVLFEVTGTNGAVRKARLNLESRVGPKEACDPWT